MRESCREPPRLSIASLSELSFNGFGDLLRGAR